MLSTYVLLGFCNNNAGIVCIAFKLTDLSGVSCVHPFKSWVTSLIYFFSEFPVANIKIFFLQKTILLQASLKSYAKSVPSLSSHTNDVTGENTFVTSTFSDIGTGWLDETDTTFIRLVQCLLCWLKPLQVLNVRLLQLEQIYWFCCDEFSWSSVRNLTLLEGPIWEILKV